MDPIERIRFIAEDLADTARSAYERRQGRRLLEALDILVEQISEEEQEEDGEI